MQEDGLAPIVLHQQTYLVMIRLTTLLFITFLSASLLSQHASSDKWTFSVDFGVQKHDKRLYHWAEFSAANLLKRQPEAFGTYQVGVSISKRILKYKGFNFYAGAGISVEKATFLRPINFLYPYNEGPEIIQYTDRYYQNLFQLPITAKYAATDKWNLTMDLLPLFNFFTIANNSDGLNGNTSYSWWGFHFYSIEINPGIEYSVGKLNFGLKYRLFQVKRIDPILFWSTSSYVIEEATETYNPFKFWCSLGYEF